MSRRALLAAARPLTIGLALVAGVALPARGQTQIAVGQMMSGTLNMADPVFTDGTHYKQFTFYGQAGQSIQIDVISSDFDAFCLLLDANNNELARDDDGGGGLNARVTRVLGYTGMYKIVVNTYRSGAYGSFTVSLQAAGGMPMATPTPIAIPTANPTGVVGSISANQQVTGNLTTMDARYDGKPFQAYSFQCMAGQSFQMDILSAWDNYALVFDPVGNIAARDDDTGEGLNARINYTCPMTGTFRLAVTTYTSSTTPGQYTMMLQSAMGAMAPTPMAIPTANPTGVIGTIAANQQVSGNLTTMDARWDGKPFQAYNFSCMAGQSFQMDILSTWDNYALVFDPVNNIVARDDDTGEGLNARVNYTCPMAGTYRLAVTTYMATTTPGQYTMTVQSAMAMAPQPAPIPQALPLAQPGATMPTPVQPAFAITGTILAPGVVGTVQVGTTVQGRLETGDQAMNDGTWADVWQFQGAAGQTVTIELRSEEFDTYLQLLDGAGNRLAEDDDSLGDLDSRVVFTLPSTGTFQLVVNNFGDSRRAGIYTLTLR